MRKRFKDNKDFIMICNYLENDDAKLKEIDFSLKRDFIGFFEELALLLNSGLIKKYVALNMFGYYALDCDSSKNFWEGYDRGENHTYITTFENFIDDMKKESIKQEKNCKNDYARKNYKL
jgi:hypothetical protein